MGRNILAVLIGLLAGAIGIYAVEALGHTIYPVPEGMDPENAEAIKTYIANAPIGALLFIILSWATGALLSGVVATLVAKRTTSIPAIVCGALLMMGGIFMMVTIPHPTWFWPIVAFAFVPMAWLGFRMVRR